MLAQVLGPGFDHEPFDHLLRIGAVFGHATYICLQSNMAQVPARTKGLLAERKLLEAGRGGLTFRRQFRTRPGSL